MRFLFTLAAVLAMQAASFGAEPPAIAKKPVCICGDSCKCKPGDCPGKCPLKAAAKPTGQWVQQCDGKTCRLVWVANDAPAVASAAPCVSCQSYSAPARSGWYPGKWLGRRR